MAVGARLIAASSTILSRALTANACFFHPIPMSASTSFPSRSIHLRAELFPSFRQNCKHFVLTPHASLSTPNVPSRISESLNLQIFPSFDLTGLTPLSICKYSAILALALAASKKVIHVLLSPFFWLYFSWTWLFWPWILASSLAIYGLYSAFRHSIGLATVVEQLAVVTSVIAWLTIVPVAHFNGFLEGWPLVLFFVYHYFFFLESSIRKRLYGDLLPRDHDAKWDLDLPRPFRAAFFLLVLIGHWLAAFEGPELHMISGGWANIGTWILIATALFMRYHSILYLAKYSEKVVVPTAVVQFGPYRFVRHPIYASTMLLFAINCITLRAPRSMLFLVLVCLAYYGRKAVLEEAIMVETFGELYDRYMEKVRYRLIPFLY